MRRPARTRFVPHLPVALTAASLLALATTARAGVLEQSFTVNVAPNPAPYQASIQLPTFDPDLGTLVEARISLTPRVTGLLLLENTDTTTPHAVTLSFSSGVALNGTQGCLALGQSSGYVSKFLMPFDGTADFDGPSGMSQEVQNVQPTVVSILPSSPEFDTFIATGGGNSTIPFTVDFISLSECDPYGDPALLFVARVSAGPEIRVTYVYTRNGAAFCSGDGSAGACPCNSFGLAGHGCAGPGTAIGGRLQASGEPTVSADTLTFHASELPKDTMIALVQGDAGLVTPFGAGLRCVSGNLLRISMKDAGGSAVIGGPSEGVSIATAGAIPPSGGMRYYQVMFRDLPSACNASTVNHTNGWRVSWRP